MTAAARLSNGVACIEGAAWSEAGWCLYWRRVGGRYASIASEREATAGAYLASLFFLAADDGLIDTADLLAAVGLCIGESGLDAKAARTAAARMRIEARP